MFFAVLVACLHSCKKEPSPPLSPSEALNSFDLADPELEIQLVASEPLVQDPVAISFDEGGRLWVVEMIGFMQDIDGTGENDPVGRVSVLFDNDGDGQMDASTIFLDSLVLPRAIAVVNGGALIAENIPLWFAEDSDGDFIADKKTLIDPTYGGQGMPEHSANGLWRGMDNWYYNAKSKTRYRQNDSAWIKEETEFRGQWGICHDNSGRLFYNYNWSQLHADLVPPNVLQRNKNHKSSSGTDHGLTLDRKIYPIRSNTAVNRGYVPGTLDEEGKLLEFASACGPLVYRGNVLPESYMGNAFVCEPTGNLIKRNSVLEDGFMLSAEGVYKNREFLASTDERFRPISLASGPDGALYVVDMYKGIIQHGPYMTDYLREVTLQRKLDKPINMGRIWRITTKKKINENPKDLSRLNPAELVNLLKHPNGWTRDMAQRLLVESKDLSIVPEIEKLVVSEHPLGQLHALWTLEGLGITSPKPYLSALHTTDPKVSQTALRLAAAMSNAQPEVREEIADFITNSYDNADPVLQLQMVLTADALNKETAFDILKKFLVKYDQYPVARDVVMSSLNNKEYEFFKNLMSDGTWKTYDQNREIFVEMLVSAIAAKGAEEEITPVLNKLNSTENQETEWVTNAIINGILNSTAIRDEAKIELTEPPFIFQKGNSGDDLDGNLLASLEKLFIWPGKPIEILDSKENLIEIDQIVLASGRQKYLNLCANCHGTQGEGMSRFAPPLKDSEWVTGDKEKLAMILLHGMEGPIAVNGKEYGIPEILPNMPSFSTLQNEDIAAISTYIRNSWGNSAEAISNGTVGKIRFRTQGKITPWTSAELDSFIFDSDL
jgi:mono/diheme cytochrome c family protein/glucose/arabinose dehydrogenase